MRKFCPGLHTPATLVRNASAGARWWSFPGGKLLLYLAQGGKKMLVWQEKEELLAQRFSRADYRTASRTTAALYANRSGNHLPVRQTPCLRCCVRAGFSSSPQGLDRV
ncbi:hypothetical protein ACLB1T_28560 [Escherichia coli]